jgi:hypothetical protein
MNASISMSRFYIVGGTVPRDASSYVVREADHALLEGLQSGQFCYVLTSRQMGKSSLMVRTAARLRQEGTKCVLLDLTAIGMNLSEERWYDGLLNMVGAQLDLEDELDDFWRSHTRLGPIHRWMRALREVVLNRIPGQVVLFLDEIDIVRSLPFSTDEFFAGIRHCYNTRTEDPEMERLTFCLLGVTTPSDLIRDTRTTPFNIGRRIELNDFTPEEAAPLAAGFALSPSAGQMSSTLVGQASRQQVGQASLPVPEGGQGGEESSLILIPHPFSIVSSFGRGGIPTSHSGSARR